jgi:hypothetical protein
MIGKVQENNIGNGIREMRSLGGLALLTAGEGETGRSL